MNYQQMIQAAQQRQQPGLDQFQQVDPGSAKIDPNAYAKAIQSGFNAGNGRTPSQGTSVPVPPGPPMSLAPPSPGAGQPMSLAPPGPGGDIPPGSAPPGGAAPGGIDTDALRQKLSQLLMQGGQDQQMQATPQGG